MAHLNHLSPLRKKKFPLGFIVVNFKMVKLES